MAKTKKVLKAFRLYQDQVDAIEKLVEITPRADFTSIVSEALDEFIKNHPLPPETPKALKKPTAKSK